MIFLYIFTILAVVNQCTPLHPVLLVPGDGGSIIMARYTASPPHYICGFRENWFVLWLNIFYVTPFTVKCFIDTIKLEYNPKDRTTFSPDFCETRIDGFGTSDSVEYFSCLRIRSTSYFYYVINDLVQNFGYVPNKSIRGAPYDFRKAPNEMGTLMDDVKGLIEQMYIENGNSSVIIIAHSMGNMYIIRLLNAVSQQWKDKYIKAFLSISPPYAGAVDAIRTALSGNNEHIPLLSPIELRTAQSTWPSTYYLMPVAEMWSSNPIVATKTGNYTAKTILELLSDSNLPFAKEHFKDIINITQKPLAPNVPVYCIYSNDVETPEFLDYRNVNFPQKEPTITFGNGDGTVNLQSLEHCTSWKLDQKEPVTTHIIHGVKHLEIMRDERLLDIIESIIRENY